MMTTEEIIALTDWVEACDEDADNDGHDLWAVAARIVETMPDRVTEQVATDWLVREVRDRRRVRTQHAEKIAARAARREREAEREERREQEFHERMNATARILNEYKATIRMEWEQELLDSRFALPDGSTVTWGEATIADHQVRAEMFTKSADASLQGAARHLQAVDVLTESGATNLREYVTQT